MVESITGIIASPEELSNSEEDNYSQKRKEEEAYLQKLHEDLDRSPIFHDEGDYSVIDGKTGEVESGTFYVDTCVASQATGSLEWEVLLKLSTDKALALPDEFPNQAYTSAGEVYRLWDQEEDLNGDKARRIHDLVVSRAKSGIPEEEIRRDVYKLHDEIMDEIEGTEPAKYPQLA